MKRKQEINETAPQKNRTLSFYLMGVTGGVSEGDNQGKAAKGLLN